MSDIDDSFDGLDELDSEYGDLQPPSYDEVQAMTDEDVKR